MKLAAFGLSIVMTIYGVLSMDGVAENSTGITRDWNFYFVSRILPTADTALRGYEYLDYWTGFFPGTILGCYCQFSRPSRRMYRGHFRHECNRNENLSNFKAVQWTAVVYLLRFSQNASMPAAQAKAFTFNGSRLLFAAEGSCIGDSRRCSDLCAPRRVSNCPLTNVAVGVSNPDLAVFDHEYRFVNFLVFTSKSSEYPII